MRPSKPALQFSLRRLFAIMLAFALLLSVIRAIGLASSLVSALAGVTFAILSYLMSTPVWLLAPPDLSGDGARLPGVPPTRRVPLFQRTRLVASILLGLVVALLVACRLFLGW